MRQSVRFVRKGAVIDLVGAAPALTLLDHLRMAEHATGAKDACSEGACGACTVALGRLTEHGIAYEPAHACTLLAAQADGCEVVTIEDLADDDGVLHPVQQGLLDEHASQCGFCTAGMAMSLFALYEAGAGPIARGEALAAIAGNLCRCTGYRPIVAAAIAAGANRRLHRHERQRGETAATLFTLADADDLVVGEEASFLFAPTGLDAAATALSAHPDAVIVAGGTVIGAALARRQKPVGKLILLGRIAELREIRIEEAGLAVGAAVSLAALRPHLAAIDPDLGALIDRIGGAQIRAQGTLGGNLAAGPRGADLAPALLALGADIRLRSGAGERSVPIDSLYRADGRIDRTPDEIIATIAIPRLPDGTFFRAFKVARRFDLATATIVAAFRFLRDEAGRIVDPRIAYGGLAAGPRRARATEAALTGVDPLDRSVWAKAFAALRSEFAPPGDARGGSRYRIETAQALLGKALIEAGSKSDRRTRLFGLREEAADVGG